MNNLPNTFDGLLELLKKFETETFDEDFQTYDIGEFAYKVVSMLDRYQANAELDSWKREDPVGYGSGEKVTDREEEELWQRLEGFYHRAHTHGMNEVYIPELWVDKLEQIIQAHTAKRITELLKQWRPILTERDAAYSIVDSLEDNRGEIVWVESLMEFIQGELDKITHQQHQSSASLHDPAGRS